MMELIRSTGVPAIGASILTTIRQKCANTTAGRGAVLLVDQAVSSGSNFLTTLIIGRACWPDEMGLYSLGASLTLMLMSIPRSLIWTPFTSFMPGLAERERKQYFGSALVHQVLLCIGLACAVSAVGMARGTPGLGKVLTILGPVMAMLLMREHVRRMCFARLRGGEALAVDVMIASLQAGGLLLLAYMGELTAARAYMVIGLASAPLVALWIFNSRHVMEITRRSVISDLVKNWHFARWMLVGALAAGISAALDPWALSAMHDTTQTGMLAAARSVIYLINPLVLGYHNFFFPHAAHVFAQEGVLGLRTVVYRAMVSVTALAGAYVVALTIWGEDVMVMLYGADYAGQGAVITAAAIADLVCLIFLPVGLGLLAAGRGDIEMKASLVQLALTVTVGMLCIYQFGAVGVGCGVTVSCLGAGLWKWLAFRSLAREAEEAGS